MRSFNLPEKKSFLSESNSTGFSIHNLPYGVFTHKDISANHIGVAIGDYVLDLTLLETHGFLSRDKTSLLFQKGSLNHFSAQKKAIWAAVRERIQQLLSIDNYELQDNPELLKTVLVDRKHITLKMPFNIGGFTDFYASKHHATNVGKLFRGNENALLPNWEYLPVAYNGRASTVNLSHQNIIRPQGQIKLPNAEAPIFSPTRRLDFELELGVFIGTGNLDGNPISIENAHDAIFGCVLLNDWSARDVQAFEYQPLGPFLAKSFATSISPWVVPYAALEPMLTPIQDQHPKPVGYLQQSRRQQFDIQLKVEIVPAGETIRTTLCETNTRELYWTIEQMIAHHTVNRCIMHPGDLFGTGTISGESRSAWGSLLELSYNGKEPLPLASGLTRTFLEDGDTIIFSGHAENNSIKISFGELQNTILPAA